MKNSALRIKTEQLTESAYDIEEYYTAGLQLIAVGNFIKNMVRHMTDLQAKVDNQAEELRKYQQKTYDIAKVVEQLEDFKELECGDTDDDIELYELGRSQGKLEAYLNAIEIVKGGAV